MSNSTNMPSLLSIGVVEGIHATAVAGKHKLVASTVAGFTDATLPGLVGYLCLRYLHGHELALPELPSEVLQSPVGHALRRVICPFGFRTTGQFSPVTDVTHKPVEFFVLRQSADYTGHFYKLFEARWATACDAVGFRSKTSALHLSMSAMTENAILHAQSSAGILVGYQQFEHAVLFTVADLGRGVLGSLRTNPDYVVLEHPREALRLALHEGVSCLGVGNGLGFHQLFKTLASQYGTLRFRTGNVCITMDGQDFESDLGEETYPQHLAGFQVTMCCRVRPTDHKIALSEL
jgi:hypothetical protein